MPERKLRVFLCHASQDKPAVRELYRRLKAEGWIDPWLDEEKLSFGQHWTTVIEDALHDADIVLIFLSRNSVQREGFVQRELNYAWELSLEKPRHVIFLIPFRLDDCEIPRYLASRQWGDYFGEKKESTYQILLRSLKQRHLQKLQLEAEENARRQAEDQARLAAEELKRKQAEAEAREARKEKEARDKRAAEEFKRRQAEERARRQMEEKARLAAEERKRKKEDDKARKAEEAWETVETIQPRSAASFSWEKIFQPKNRAALFFGSLGFLVLLFGIFGLNAIIKNTSSPNTPTPTGSPPAVTATSPSTRVVPEDEELQVTPIPVDLVEPEVFKQYDAPPPMTIDVEKKYFATVELEKGGTFVVELYPDKAPITVNSFVFLAREGYFDGVTFHRVLEGFMAQGGDPTGSGSGGPGYEFVNEDSDLTFDKAGVVAMANAGRDTNGSQFFITFGPAEFLNGGYTIFGQVIEGMDVVDGITRRDPDLTPNFTGDVIATITITEE